MWFNLVDVYEQHRELIFFVYGLVYVLTGFAILVKNVKVSQFKLAKYIRLFALFGIFHGLADWAPAFLPLNELSLTPQVYDFLRVSAYLLLSVSYVFLFMFGLKVVLPEKDKKALAPLAVFVMWLFLISAFKSRTMDFDTWLALSNTLARYFLGFPAAITASYAFFKQTKVFRLLDMPRLIDHMWWGALFIAVYGFFTGLVGSRLDFFPANVLNYQTFIAVTGVPVQIFRLAAGVGIGINIVKSLELFDVEQKKRVEEAERKQATLQERGRISREMHDGTIQSLYGIGLTLEQSRRLMKDVPDHPAGELLDFSIMKLDETIKDIRSYIMDLQQLQFQDIKLRQSILELLNEFAVAAEITPVFNYKENGTQALTPDQRVHIYHIIKESLNNVRRHAQAKLIELNVALQKELIDISINDDGRGFDQGETGFPVGGSPGDHRGLKNMKERIDAMGGQMEIVSNCGQGTKINFIIPYRGETNG